MGMFDDLHDRPIHIGDAIRGIKKAVEFGCSGEIRECLQAAVDVAEQRHGISSPAYTVLLALRDSI